MAMRRGDHHTALKMVDDALAGVYVRVGIMGPHSNSAEMHALRARLLLLLGMNAPAVDEYLGLLSDRFESSRWSPGPYDLKSALRVALSIGNSEAVDAIATRIDETSGWHSPDFPFLNPDEPGKTPARRLAHAYLALSHIAAGDMKYAEEVRLCEEARELTPDEIPVLARLASAYLDRNGQGDRNRALAQFRRAYALLPAGAVDRRNLRIIGSNYGLDAAPPGAKTTLQDDLGAFIREAPAREAAQRAARERKRSEWMLQHGGPGIGSPAARP